MTGIPDEMLDAAWKAYRADLSDPGRDDMRAALAAALDAAPTADGTVWCEQGTYGSAVPTRGAHGDGTCPGPHHALIVGPAFGDDT